jgi:hypothetical protein
VLGRYSDLLATLRRQVGDIGCEYAAAEVHLPRPSVLSCFRSHCPSEV